ncbi:MAG: hypothetical protein ABEK12_00300, partial [Candidatus Nanohaloarchaea archaeon]
MNRTVLFLAAAVLVAGCTQLPTGGGGGKQAAQPGGLRIVAATLTDSTVQRGDTARLRLRLANDNPTPVTKFS